MLLVETITVQIGHRHILKTEVLPLPLYRAVSTNMPLIEKVLRGKVIVPEFAAFTREVENIYKECASMDEGEVGAMCGMPMYTTSSQSL